MTEKRSKTRGEKRYKMKMKDKEVKEEQEYTVGPGWRIAAGGEGMMEEEGANE